MKFYVAKNIITGEVIVKQGRFRKNSLRGKGWIFTRKDPLIARLNELYNQELKKS